MPLHGLYGLHRNAPPTPNTLCTWYKALLAQLAHCCRRYPKLFSYPAYG